MIFFVSLKTGTGDGHESYYVDAPLPFQAGHMAATHHQKQFGGNVKVDSVSEAIRQNKKKYCFPSSIL